MAKKEQAKPSNAPALEPFHEKAAALSAARDALGDKYRLLQGQLRITTDAQMPAIRAAARVVAQLHEELATMIKGSPELFEKPRTHITAGIKFGKVKKPGKLDWADDATVVKRIRDMIPLGELTEEVAETAIQTSEKPVAAVLNTFDARLLKRIGVTVGADSDEPFIRAVDGEVEKAVNAIIKEVTGDANAEVSV